MGRAGYPSDKQDQYMLRFPDGMRDRLKSAAAANGRSLNAEIVKRIERTIAWDAFQAEHLGYFADLQRAAGDEVPADAQLDADAESEFHLNAPPAPKSIDEYGAPPQPGQTAAEIVAKLDALADQVQKLASKVDRDRSTERSLGEYFASDEGQELLRQRDIKAGIYPYTPTPSGPLETPPPAGKKQRTK